jgi:hypothetical protein
MIRTNWMMFVRRFVVAIFSMRHGLVVYIS